MNTKNYWIADASGIDVDENLERIIYSAPGLDRFVTGSSKFILAGNKGMGKTLLLTYKRYIISKQLHENEEVCVPLNHPYLDSMDDLPDLDKKWKESLEELRYAKRLWRLSIQLSAFAHWFKLQNLSTKTKLPDLPDDFRQCIDPTQPQSPTTICQFLLSLPPSHLWRQLDKSVALLNSVFRQIRPSMYIFIDRVDQASDSLSRKAWINFQMGLALAAVDLHNANKHVKTSVTIRQEAYANHKGTTRANLASSVTEIKYTRSDVEAIINNLASCSTQQASDFSQFVRLESVYNNRSDSREPVYDYMFRHTVGRPRDLVRIAEELSDRRIADVKDPMTRENNFKKIVNAKSKEIVSQEVFEEVQVFLDALRDEEHRWRLLKLLPYNILTRHEIENIASTFNGSESPLDFSVPGPQHPFCELYNAGLLGVLGNGLEPGKVQQRFKQPRDPFNPNFSSDLPASDFYFVHPGLNRFIDNKVNSKYCIYRYVIVGDGSPWSFRSEMFVACQRELARQMPDIKVLLANKKPPHQLSHDKFYSQVMTALRHTHDNGRGGGDNRLSLVKEKMGADWASLTRFMIDHDCLRQVHYLVESAATCSY